MSLTEKLDALLNRGGRKKWRTQLQARKLKNEGQSDDQIKAELGISEIQLRDYLSHTKNLTEEEIGDKIYFLNDEQRHDDQLFVTIWVFIGGLLLLIVFFFLVYGLWMLKEVFF